MIAQRKQHLQQLDDLLKSVFLEMFGDPVRNEKAWAERELGETFKIKHGFAFTSEFFSDDGPYVLLTPGNTSPTKIESIVVGYPPIDLQNQFATIVEKVEGIKSRYQESLNDLKALYGALSQQAFKGELDLSRVPLPMAHTPPVPAVVATSKSPLAVLMP